MLKMCFWCKTVLIAFFLFVVSSAISFAQVKDGLKFEIGGGYHFNKAFGVSNGLGKTSGPEAYFEIRNCDKNIDYGGQLCYKYSTGSGYATDNGQILDQIGHLALLKAIADYNICPDCIVNPYVGLGLGIGYLHVDRSDNLKSDNLAFALSVRLGCQISIVRLTFDYDIYSTGIRSRSRISSPSVKALAHTLSMTLGFVIE